MRRNPLTSIFPYLDHNSRGNISLQISKRRCLARWHLTILLRPQFVEVTAQVQCYSRIDMCSVDYVSDTARNGFLYLPTTKKQMEGHQQGFFHGLPDELQITLVMVDMEDAPENRQSNKNDPNRKRTMRHMKSELTQVGLSGLL